MIPDSRDTPSTTNLEEEEIVDAPGNDGNASMPEQVKRPNPWRKMMIMMIMMTMIGATTALRNAWNYYPPTWRGISEDTKQKRLTLQLRRP